MENWLIEESDKVQEMIKNYFTLENWNTIPVTLRYRYLISTRNYLNNPNRESFMPKPDYIRYQKPLLDESWNENPSFDSEKSKGDTKQTKRKPSIKPKGDFEKVRKYPKRENIPKKNYFEEEPPSDDRYIFCDTCQEEYLDVCTKCGSLVSLEDNPVPKGTRDRAIKTAPKGVLEVRQSVIHGFGVFALKNLRKGIRLGPYEGNVTRIDTNNGYAWKLRDGKLVDANKTTNSNYLRYVNCPRSVSEQNLVAFQYKGNLYYRTCREIIAGEELLVFYGTNFAKNLGIDPKKYFEPEEVETIQEFYPCKFCFIGLGGKEFRDRHEKFCRFNPMKMRPHVGEVYKCQMCGCGFTSKEYLEAHEKKCKMGGRSKQQRCSYCQREFVFKSQLEVHIVEVHGKENGKGRLRDILKCEYCDYKTLNISEFGRHQLIHSKGSAKCYSCNVCNFASNHKGDLKRHLRLHSGTLPFACIECKGNYNEKHELDNHILKKHGDNADLISSITSKIHYCKLCGYKTIISYHFKMHQLKHSIKTDMKKYICPHCEYSTYDGGNHKRHLLTHSTNFPFSCNECNKKFNRKHLLDSHILTNHKTNRILMESITHKIHRCKFCPYQTIFSTNIKTHLKNHS